MQSIRGQLATWYALAMGATLGVFAVSVYVGERSWISDSIDDRLQIEADLIAAIVSGARASRAPDTTTATSTNLSNPWVAYVLGADVAAMIAGVSDYVLLLSSGPSRAQHYFNDRAAVHNVADRNAFATAARRVLEDGERFGHGNLGRPVGRIRLYVSPVDSPNISAVVAGAPSSEVGAHLDRLLSAMMGVATLVVALSTWIAYLLAGRTLKPVDLIIDEVEAISDGRSLHRRLAIPNTEDEAARLASTLNAMLGRLESSFFLLRRFTADASHELKTPLTVLRSGIERAITHPSTTHDVLEVLEETLVEVNRMTELVDSLLMLARKDEGRAGLHKEPVDLREILGELSETAGILVENSSVSVFVEIPEEPEVVPVDHSRLRQLLMNLLTNAIKFNRPDGTVTVTTAREDAYVVIRVSDTGIGMSGSELEHMYQRFWRADPARSRTGQRAGAGLGMAISKWIAEAHGGSIEAESKRGQGTTITVKLPLEDET